jgi:hypothetical protein
MTREAIPMSVHNSSPKIRMWLMAVAVLASSWAAWAGGLVPVPLRSAIIIRSAGYERGFAGRSGKAVLAVISGKSGASEDDGRAMAGALAKATQIGGRTPSVVQIAHESSTKTVGELQSQRAEIIYVAKGLEGLVKDIPGQADGISRIIVCADGADVGVGCTLGVELADDKPSIVFNLKQANAAGLRFQPEFLRLARIVR